MIFFLEISPTLLIFDLERIIHLTPFSTFSSMGKIMKKKIVYSEKYHKGTFIAKPEILKFLHSSVVLSPEILEAIRYNDDSESYIIKINIPKEYLDNK